jgi:hypothetical protein
MKKKEKHHLISPVSGRVMSSGCSEHISTALPPLYSAWYYRHIGVFEGEQPFVPTRNSMVLYMSLTKVINLTLKISDEFTCSQS